MDPLDTSWCPVCDRQILPKRLTIPVAPPAPAPSTSPSASSDSSAVERTKSTANAPRTRGGLVHGTGRAKLGAPRRTATKDTAAATTAAPAPATVAKPVKTKSVIDQSPIPLYCSDECQLADFRRVNSYDEPRSAPLPMATRADSTSSSSSESDSSVSSSYTHASARSYQEMSPSVAKLAEIYDFPALPPPPPLLPSSARAAQKAPISRADDYQHGIMEAGRKLRAVLRPPPPPKRTAFQSPSARYTAQMQAKQRAPVPGWTDGSDAWRASVYSMSAPQDYASVDPKDPEVSRAGYSGFVAFSHRASGGVVSSLSRAEVSPVSTTAASPDAISELYGNYPLFDARREQARARMYAAPGSSPSSLPSSSKREVPLLPASAKGKLLVPENITLRRNSSSASVTSMVTSPGPRSPRVMSRRGSGMSEMAILPEGRTVVVPAPKQRITSADDLTYTVPLPMQRERRTVTEIVNGQEVSREVDILVPKERAPRLFLGPSGFDEGRVARRRERELAALRARRAESAAPTV